jgi:phosphoserine phosphatase RsbU/P
MKKPVLQYAVLTALLVIAVAFQTRNSVDIVGGLLRPYKVMGLPFHIAETRATLTNVGPDGVKAGLGVGDVILAIDGRPYTGTVVLLRALDRHYAQLRITVRKPSGQVRTVMVQLPRSESQFTGIGIRAVLFLIYLVMPVFCILLGFWVAFARPRDSLAWLLLALMLSFSQLIEVHPETWGIVIRDLAQTYHVALAATWPIWMFLFGLYFPEAFPRSKQDWILRPLQWGMVAALGLLCLMDIVVGVGAMESVRSIAWLSAYYPTLSKVGGVLSFLAIGTFFGATCAKMFKAKSPDVKRRLRLLYLGSTASMTPLFILVLVSLAKGQSFTDPHLFPPWLVVVCFLMIFGFPLTLAYVIVVHRAMDVHVVIRQGLQYALAARAIRALSIGITVGAAIYLYYTLEHIGSGHLILKIGIVALGWIAAAKLRSRVERLKSWTDRRFFRDEFHAETVLAELSEKVRSMVETRPLIETVSRSIADSLHVSRVAALLRQNGQFVPAFAFGYDQPPQVAFPAEGGTVKQLAQGLEPARVYMDDPNSWVHRSPEITEDERQKLAALRAQLLLPIGLKEQLLGFLTLGEKRSEEPYSGMDLRLLKSVAAQTGMALENAHLTAAIAQEVAQREKLNREVEIAREVQERLFPQKLPAIPGLDYCGACRTALGVGGDYYDFLALPGGKLGIALGDVSGKGIAAALMMASLQASLRSEAMRAPQDLAALITNVNRLVYEASAVNRYATFFYAQYDPETRRLTYVNAGHNPPMIFKRTPAGWQVRRLETGGTVVGLLENYPYQQGEELLAHGDLLVAFTDGISEAMNSADEEWGESRLTETIEASADTCAPQLIERIMRAADDFAAGAPQHDDMTLVVLRCGA